MATCCHLYKDDLGLEAHDEAVMIFILYSSDGWASLCLGVAAFGVSCEMLELFGLLPLKGSLRLQPWWGLAYVWERQIWAFQISVCVERNEAFLGYQTYAA